MNFAFVIFKYFPFGGIQRDMMKIAREALARGHSVKVFTLRWQAPEPDHIDLEVLPIVGVSRHAQYDHFAAQVAGKLRAQHYDLVLGFNKMPGLDVYYAGDSCYIEKALTQRQSWYRLLPRFKSFHAAEKAVFDADSTTQILTISDNEVPRYRHHYRTAPQRFHALPPGIERDRVAPADKTPYRQRVRAELGLTEAQRLVLFIGSGFIKKGLDRALLAVAALPRSLREEVRLVVIGRDKGEAFERMAMRLGIKAQVTFFTEGRDDIPDFLFAADGLLHPAYDETAGMVLIEAMLAGVPVLTTKDCGYAKYISEHQAGIVLPNPFSQAALNRGLVDLLLGEQRAAWAANGIAAAADESLFRLVPQTVDYLEKFATQRQPVLVFCLYRYFAFGGLQRDFLRIAQACQQAGYQIVVYTMQWFGDVPEGFRIIKVPTTAVANYNRYQDFAAYVADQARWQRPLAIIGFNKMPGLDMYYAADPCFEQKAHEMRSRIYRHTKRYKVLARFERAVFAQSSATQIMLITQAQREVFQQYYHTQNARMHLLPPGVSRDRARGDTWQQQRAAVRAEFGLRDDQLLLLLLGSGFITKGLDRALLALSSLPAELLAQTQLLVIGQDHPGAFLRQAQRLGIADHVRIEKGRHDIPAVLQGADLMIHPAYMESGGLVLIEAVIAGLPVIASGICGFAPFITDADAGAVMAEPFDQAAFDQTVCQVLRDPDLRARWSANGQQFGRERQDLYDMPAHALQVIQQNLPYAPSPAGHQPSAQQPSAKVPS